MSSDLSTQELYLALCSVTCALWAVTRKSLGLQVQLQAPVSADKVEHVEQSPCHLPGASAHMGCTLAPMFVHMPKEGKIVAVFSLNFLLIDTINIFPSELSNDSFLKFL